jgi:diacylglycerol kinase family enzyme
LTESICALSGRLKRANPNGGERRKKVNGSQRVEHLCVINPKSFPRKANLDAFIKNCMEKMAERALTVHVSRFPRDAIGVIRAHAANCEPGARIRVYAVGGDGILFDCLNGVVGLEHADIAPMPYGASNDFVRAFGEGRFELFRDIALLSDAPALPTDVIRCTRNYALNFCAVGLESKAYMQTRALNRRFKKYRDRFPFLYASARRAAIASCAFQTSIIRQSYRISVDDEDFSGNYAAVNIANGPCYSRDKVAVIHAVPDDGLLDALFTKAGGPMDVLKMAPLYLKGQYWKFPEKILHRRGKKFTLCSDAPLMVNMDGEVFFDTRLTLEIVPAAVRIVAPAGVTYERRDETYA